MNWAAMVNNLGSLAGHIFILGALGSHWLLAVFVLDILLGGLI